VFEVLDELELDENSKADPVEELRILREMRVRKLEKAGSAVVNLNECHWSKTSLRSSSFATVRRRENRGFVYRPC